jgi:uncharacterized membrane-anchored protein YitT (DUF2179 family)
MYAYFVKFKFKERERERERERENTKSPHEQRTLACMNLNAFTVFCVIMAPFAILSVLMFDTQEVIISDMLTIVALTFVMEYLPALPGHMSSPLS